MQFAHRSRHFSGRLAALAEWLLGDSHTSRWAIAMLAWLLLVVFGAAARFAYLFYRDRVNRTSATAAATPLAPRVKFAPESFDLSPARSRALLALRQRIDSRTTLHALFELVTELSDSTDMELTKAQLQQDMEAAEQAGIVSIDRVGPLTQLYNLTTPAGRDWVLSKERDLEIEAKKGMTRRARGPRHF
jgi:hypothetical protein